MARRTEIERLYEHLAGLATRVGGTRRLGDCTGYMDWPERGVYFFLSPDETHHANGFSRIVRVGTHAVSTGSGTSLWDRLRTHRGANSGTYEGGGNHRGSVFRKRVGEALMQRHGLSDQYPNWGNGSSAGRERRLSELPMEQRVSEYIRDLPVLWLSVPDAPGPDSDRAYLERNVIALLSNYRTDAIDARPETWLGTHSPSEHIRMSGLWNVNHVDEQHDSAFLQTVGEYADTTGLE